MVLLIISILLNRRGKDTRLSFIFTTLVVLIIYEFIVVTLDGYFESYTAGVPYLS